MIKLASADFDSNYGIDVSVGEMKITVLDNRFEEGIIGYKINEVDLNKLVATTRIYEYPDIARREVEAVEEQKKQRSERVILGAIGGAALDSFIGDDDSVIDGAITGAAIAYMTTPAAQVDLKEQTSHYVVLFFADGNSIAVCADAKGYAKILRIEHKARMVPLSKKEGSYIEGRNLNSQEIEKAEAAALYNLNMGNQNLATGVFLLGALIIMCSFFSHILFDTAIPFTGEDFDNLGFGVIIAVLMLSSIPLHFYGKNKTDTEIAAGKGKPVKIDIKHVTTGN